MPQTRRMAAQTVCHFSHNADFDQLRISKYPANAHEINYFSMRPFSMRPSFKSLPQILPTISSKKPYHKQKKTDSLPSRISCQSFNNSYFLSSSHSNAPTPSAV